MNCTGEIYQVQIKIRTIEAKLKEIKSPVTTQSMEPPPRGSVLGSDLTDYSSFRGSDLVWINIICIVSSLSRLSDICTVARQQRGEFSSG